MHILNSEFWILYSHNFPWIQWIPWPFDTD